MLIGIGKNSNIYSAMSVNTGELVAYKSLHMELEQFHKINPKLDILYSLSHNNILNHYRISNPYNLEKEGKIISYSRTSNNYRILRRRIFKNSIN